MKVGRVLQKVWNFLHGIGFVLALITAGFAGLVLWAGSETKTFLIYAFGTDPAWDRRKAVIAFQNKDELMRHGKPEPDDYFAHRRLDRGF